MFSDVVDLREFYESPLGQVARRMIRRRLRELWPDVARDSVLGLGYATPYLQPFLAEAERVVAVMPARQGVIHWPRKTANIGGDSVRDTVRGSGNRVALADEVALPFPDLFFDRVLMVHAVEGTEQLRPMLREVWRVLKASGRLIVVVPNRRGIWARFDHTPFGHGHPYTHGQLSRLMRDTLFTPMAEERALYLPPVRSRMALASAEAVERIGHGWFHAFAGVNLLEAGKQLYAGTVVGETRPKRRVLLPLPRPVAGAAARRPAGLHRDDAGDDLAPGEEDDAVPGRPPVGPGDGPSVA